MARPATPVLVVLAVGGLLTLGSWLPLIFADGPQGAGRRTLALVSLPVGPACLAMGAALWIGQRVRVLTIVTAALVGIGVIVALGVGQGFVYLLRVGLPAFAAILVALSTARPRGGP